MNRIYRIVFNRTLGVPQVVSELASAPGGVTVGALPSVKQVRVRALAAALGLTLTTVALPAWAQSCTQTSGTVTTSCTGTTGTNGGSGGYVAGGSPAQPNSGQGGGAGINGIASGYSQGGSGGAFAGNGGRGGDFGGAGGGGGVYGGGGGGGAFSSGASVAGGGGGLPGLVATGSITGINSGVLITGGAGAAGGTHTSTWGGGGGGGGAGLSFPVSGSSFANAGTVAGGRGGTGGVGNDGAGGGGGGGMGFSISGSTNSGSNSGSIRGGAGGNAGTSPNPIWSYAPAAGGNGGAGLSVTGAENTFANTGVISGGNGGTSTVSIGTGGVGVGISGNNDTLITSGGISGGLDGNGANPNFAVDITGNNNTVELHSGYSFTGNVASTLGNGNVLALGGSTSDSFDVSSIGGEFSGFDSFAKTGASTWTLTGTTAAVTPWTINAGTLAISDDAALGDRSGALTINGGTLETTADLTASRNVALGASGGSINADANTTATFGGLISDAVSGTPGSLTLNGAGTLVLTAGESYTGQTIVAAGTLALSGNGSIASSSAVIANGTFDISNTTNGASIVSLGGSGNVTLGTQSLSLTNAHDAFYGVISGSGGLNVAGSVEILLGDNTYTGGTTIASGSELLIGNQGTTGSIIGGVTNDGYLLFDRTDAVTYAGAVSGTGGLYQYALGSLTLTGVSTFTGNAVIYGGTLALSGNGSIADAYNVADYGTFDISNTANGASINSLTGSGNVNLGTQTLTLTNAVDTFSGAISGGGGLTLLGGTETLTGADTYTGDTTINVGTLTITSGGTINGTGNVVDNGTLIVDGVGSGITANAGGTPFLVGSNNGTGIGSLTVSNDALANSSGELNIGQSAGDIGTVTITSGANFTAADSTNVGKAGSGTLTVSDGGTFDSAFLSIADTAGSTGTVNVTGAGSSVTVASGGAVVVGNHGGNGALTIGDGATVAADSVSIAADAGSVGVLTIGAAAGNPATASGTLDTSSVTFGNGTGSLVFNHTDTGYTFDPTISGNGAVDVLAGTTIFTAYNTYNGATTIGGGTLALSGTGSIANSGDVIDNGTFDISATSSGASIVSLGGSSTGSVNLGTQTLTLTNANDTFAGVIGGSGGLVLAAGQQVLNGTNTYTGLTEVQGGTLVIGGDATASSASIQGNAQVDNGATVAGFGTVAGDLDVAAGAHLAPGNGNALGTLTVGGNLTLEQGSELDFAFGAPGATASTAGTGDSVTVVGNLSLNGAVLNVSNAGGFGPGLYNLFSYTGGLTETNGGITLGTVPAGDVLAIQSLTADKQINLINAGNETLNFWNANGLASPTQMGGGSGTWSVTAPNWTDATGSVTAAMNPQPGFAIFGGAAGTVTIDNSAGSVSATGMQFVTTGYVLTGDTLTLVADANGDAPVIRVGDGTTASSTDVATISNAVTGTDGLVKSDYGTLILSGQTTITGASAVNGGELDLDGNGSTFTGGFTLASGSTLLVGGSGAGVSVSGTGGAQGTPGFVIGPPSGGQGKYSITGGPGGNGTAGGAGVSGSGFTLINNSQIIGGTGGSGASGKYGSGVSGSGGAGAAGGAGVNGSTATLTNTGVVAGGYGGHGGNGGGGIDSASQTVGGAGYSGGTGGDGGAGVTGSGFTLINSGVIAGGNGGYGGAGGAGNSGTSNANQTGGAGGMGGNGGAGGAGVSGSQFSLDNSGLVAGGAGGSAGEGGNGGSGSSSTGTAAAGVGGAGGMAGLGGVGGAGVGGSNFNVTNEATGTIAGGQGGYGGYSRAGGAGGNNSSSQTTAAAGVPGAVSVAGVGGAGITGTNFQIVNNGTVTGGYGGQGGEPGNNFTTATAGAGGVGGAGGAGIGGSYANVTNSATGSIAGGQGGFGGFGSYSNAAGAASGAGGNGGTGGAGISAVEMLISNAGAINGGVGGFGHYGASDGSDTAMLSPGGAAGAGGAGGAGVAGSSFTLTNTGTVTGGAGGAGAYGKQGASYGGANGNGGNGGAGGAGGAGVSGSSFTVINSGSIVGGAGGIGGAGGAAGTGYAGAPAGTAGAAGTGGAGGVGVVSTGNSIVLNSGSIAGGLGADGTQANAVDFSGGNNTLEIDAGYSFAGNVVSTSGTTPAGDTLALGGATNDSFDVSQIGAVGSSLQYQGFANFAKVGSSTWTLTGSGNASEAWTIVDGTLAANTTSLVGNVTFAPGTGETAVVDFDQTQNGIYAGAVSGDGTLEKTGAATLTMTGASTYTGGTTISAGTLQLGNGGTTGSITGNVIDSGTLAFDRSDAVTVGGVISGTGNVAQIGSGITSLTGANTYTGGTTISAGTLQLGNGGTTGSIAGNVTNNGTLAFDHSDEVSFAGVISGAGGVAQSGAGSLMLTAINTYTGGTAINAGTLVLGGASEIGSGTLAMGPGTTLDLANSFTLANAITLSGDPTINVGSGLSSTLSGGISDGTQAGDLVKTGGGTLVLTGTDTYTGGTAAAAGTLDVEGSLTSAVSVDNGATLVGTGSTGGLTVSDGGTVAPGGAAIGTLTVNGNASLAAGSTYLLDANDIGSSDLIHATGTAALGGGSVVAVFAGSNWNASLKYTILTANGGVGGTFGAVSNNFAFLNPTLSYDANDVYLNLVRNAVAFPTVGVTPNEIHTGAAIEALGAGNAVYNAVLPLAVGPARAAFAELAGDSLASTRTAIVDDSHYVRDAINNHLQGAQGTGETTQANDQGSVWASIWGHGGNNDSDGNAARMGSNGSGLLVGADRNLDAWRVGAVAGSGQLSNNTTYGSGDAHSTDTVFGLYTGVDVGAWQFQGGAAHSWYDTDSHRQIDVTGLEGRATASDHTGVTQAYVDGGYQFTFGQGSLTPYADVARVWVHQNAINEGSTEAAALNVQASGTAVNYGTVGLRGVYNPSPVVQLHASVGFQQAWGDLRSIDQQSFANGGTTSFTVAGVPVAKSSGVLDFGMRLQLSKSVSVDTSYHGQFASGARDQGARMALNVAF